MELFDTIVTPQAEDEVLHCLRSGYLSEGSRVREFEKRLEYQFSYSNCIAVNSGTSALHLVLWEILKPGDEVILPAQTFIATGLAVLYCGGVPVFADIDPMTGCISVEDARRKCTNKTKALISVSWAGNPPDLEGLDALCKEKNIYFIQDNAQALGATYKDRPITNWGDFSCFSFQATKHLTTGDGGMIAAHDRGDYEILKDLRWFGISRDRDLADHTGERQYILYDVGLKVHMNDYAAALGIGNLYGIVGRIMTRQGIASAYDHGFEWHKTHEIYYVNRRAGSSCWVYDVLVNRRDDFLYAMHEKGIPASVLHTGIHHQPVFNWTGALRGQSVWDNHHVSLPCHSSMTADDVGQVIDAVNGGW